MGTKDHPTSCLLVEGNEDFHVIHSLCNRANVSVRNKEYPRGGNFSIKNCEGIVELFKQIPTSLKSLSTIGIIIDADTEIANRWAAVKNILTSQGFEVPNELPLDGLILQNADNKTIGVWIMPNNNLNGMLEDFVAFLVPEGDPLLPTAKKTLEDIEAAGLNKYADIHKAKATIHTWLAWQVEPGKPMGQGITQRYLTTDGETCQKLVNWLNELFTPNNSSTP